MMGQESRGGEPPRWKMRRRIGRKKHERDQEPRRWTAAGVLGFILVSLTGSYGKCAESAPVPLGLPALAPVSTTREAAALGRKLFRDSRLSADGTVSCASCHDPTQAFTDGKPRALGVDQRLGTRNAPSLYNVVYGRELFWDGRAPNLEAQAILPFVNPREMGSTSAEQILGIVRGDATYIHGFRAAFNLAAADIDMRDLARALVAYERTLLSGDSPFDRYEYGHDRTALSVQARRGLELFRGRAGCAACHLIGSEAALLTDFEYHRSAIPLSPRTTARLVELAQQVRAWRAEADVVHLNRQVSGDVDLAALGRFVVTGSPRDIGLFRTPSLRNVALTAPYMHDGSVATLEDALGLELYGRSGSANSRLVLTEEEQGDLVAFLRSLTGTAHAGRAAAEPGAAVKRPRSPTERPAS